MIIISDRRGGGGDIFLYTVICVGVLLLLGLILFYQKRIFFCLIQMSTVNGLFVQTKFQILIFGEFIVLHKNPNY